MNKNLLHPDDAAEIIREYAQLKDSETVRVERALGRVLSEDLIAQIDQPPFTKASMDGYAYSKHKDKKSNVYLLVEDTVISAGVVYEKTVEEGQCIKIMTGAPVPHGCTNVQRVEWTKEIKDEKTDKTFIEFIEEESRENIIRLGENYRAGEIILSKTIIKAKEIGILSGEGLSRVKVRKYLTVGVVSTGNEIADPGVDLKAGEIYDSNGYQISAASRELNCDTKFYGIVKDDEKKMVETFNKVLKERDILIVSGGVSMGVFDYIPSILEKIGVKKIFHGLYMKPGKPCYFGKKDDKAVFALPGNPFSTFVCYEALVKAYIYGCLGLKYSPMILRCTLTETITRKDTDRLEYFPAKLILNMSLNHSMNVTPLPHYNSSMLSSLSNANALIRVEIGVDKIEKGSVVYARLI